MHLKCNEITHISIWSTKNQHPWDHSKTEMADGKEPLLDRRISTMHPAEPSMWIDGLLRNYKQTWLTRELLYRYDWKISWRKFTSVTFYYRNSKIKRAYRKYTKNKKTKWFVWRENLERNSRNCKAKLGERAPLEYHSNDENRMMCLMKRTFLGKPRNAKLPNDILLW